MTVRRLIVILATALLCGCVFVVAGCGSTDAAATTATRVTATTVTTETAQLYPVSVDDKWGYIDEAATGDVVWSDRWAT